MRALVVTVSPDDVELASDALWSLGVVAVEERPAGDVVELWTSLGDEFEPHLAWPWRLEEVDEAVADSWRQYAKPVEVAPGLIVKPAWVMVKAAAGTTVVSIEPGATFGAGDHPTTLLCLRAIERLVAPGATVLDVGCGSGVLAVTAMKLGARRAVGIDISPAAVPVTLANAAANDVDVDVSTAALHEVDERFDLVVANILAPALVDLADDLRRVVAPDGALVISGILASPDRHRHVLDALAPLVVAHIDTLDSWAAITLRHGRGGS